MKGNMSHRIQKFLPTPAQNFLASGTLQGGNHLSVGDWKAIVGMIIGLGVVLRLIPYFHNRSLWLDETWLALNILQKPFSQLVGHLDWKQMAPVGFLFLEKTLVLTFGDSEYALRLFPLLAGILSLFLFYGVARRILTYRGLIIALGLFAGSSFLIRYSSELKQYSSDVTIALGICLLGLVCMEKESRFIFSLFLLSIVGAILIWFSHPAIFSLAGVGITLTLYYLKDKNWHHVAWLSLPAGFWLGSFAVNYFITLRELSQTSKMENAWAGSSAFMPLAPSLIDHLMWYPANFFSMFSNPGGLRYVGLAALCFVVGWVLVFSEKRYACYILTLPILFTLMASGLHKYPFQGRLILFLVPAMMIFIGEGVDRIITRVKPTGGILGVSLCALLVLSLIVKIFLYVLNPERAGEIEDVRPVMTYLSQHYQKGDRLYLYHSSEAPFLYYAKQVGLEKVQYQRAVGSKNNWDSYIHELRGLRGNDRVWILFSHVHKGSGIDEEKFFVFTLNGMGTQVDSFKRTGASLYLYNLPSPAAQ